MQEVSGSSPLSSTLFRARVRPKVTISSHLDPARYVLSWGDFKGCPHALSAKWIARPPWRLLSRGRPRDYRPGTVRRRDRAIFPTIPVLRRHARRWPDPDRCAGATARDRSLHHRGAPPPAVRRSVEIEQTEGHRRSSCLPLTRGASLPSHTLAWSSATSHLQWRLRSLRDLGGDDPVAVAGIGVEIPPKEEKPLSHAREPVAAVDRLPSLGPSVFSSAVGLRIVSVVGPSLKSSRMRTGWCGACLAALTRDSWAARVSARAASGGSGLARPVTSTVTGVS